MLFVTSFVLLRTVKKTTSEIRSRSRELQVIYLIALGTQIALIGIFGAVLTQILLLSEYHTLLLELATVINYVSASTVMFISSLTMFAWIRVNRNSYVVIIFGVAFAVNVYVYVYLGIYETYNLADKGQIITPESEVIYASDTFEPGSIEDNLRDVYDYAVTGIFLMLVAGSATLLHHYAAKIGRVKFWLFLLLPLVYYLSTLVEALGIYNPVSDAELFNYYIYLSLTGVVAGAVLGFAFWLVSKSLSPNKSAANYLKLCAFGLALQSVAEAGGVAGCIISSFWLC